MKKILCVALVLVMALSLTSAVSAVTSEANSEALDYLEGKFFDYCKETLGEDSMPGSPEVNIVDTRETIGGTFFVADSWIDAKNESYSEIYGGRCYHSDKIHYPYGLGVYYCTNQGEVYDLATAYNEKIARFIPLNGELSGIECHDIDSRSVADSELFHKCLYAFADRFGYEPENGEIITCRVFGNVEDYTIFRAYYSHGDHPAMNAQERIGDYYFHSASPYGGGRNNSVALFVLSGEGELYTLYEAFSQGLIEDLSEVANLTGGTSIFGRYGERIIENLGIDITAEDWTHTFNEVAAFGNGYSWSNTDGDIEYEFVIVRAGQRIEEEGTYIRRAGKYIVISDNKYSDYDLGCYVYIPKLDTVFTFESAIERLPGLEDKIVRSFRYNEYCSCSVFGDVSGNITVDINDATMIQKHVAGFYSLSANDLLTGDVNGDGELNVRDATMLQKHIAGLLDIYE